ncbi:DUF2283 domain-containing protein [Herbiconiux sp. P18]|uniref:DUF2283 domain-containing protein n=1 Tax=Herbiconiux liangxiaofengii TaxID=3342795 RepID=UPI0035B88DA1
MKLTYDPIADASYVRLVERTGFSMVARTVIAESILLGTSINLDFDSDGQLLGIEILGASRALRPETIKQAEVLR